MLEGENLRGRADLRGGAPEPDAVARIALERLALDDLPGAAASGIVRASQPWVADLDVEDLSIGGRRLGRWSGRVAGVAERFGIPTLRFADRGRQGGGQLRCGMEAGVCRLEIGWTGTAPDSVLDAEISEGRAVLSWPVSASAIAALDGHLSVRAANGQLRARAASTATADMVEQALFAPALALLAAGPPADAPWQWNRLDLDAALRDGVLQFERYAIDGAQRRLQIAGRVMPAKGHADVLAEWVPAQPFSVAVGRWPAGPALLAAWSAVRDLIPGNQEPAPEPATRFFIEGPLEQLSVTPLPLQSAAAP
jgi:hypothetical protein